MQSPGAAASRRLARTGPWILCFRADHTEQGGSSWGLGAACIKPHAPRWASSGSPSRGRRTARQTHLAYVTAIAAGRQAGRCAQLLSDLSRVRRRHVQDCCAVQHVTSTCELCSPAPPCSPIQQPRRSRQEAAARASATRAGHKKRVIAARSSAKRPRGAPLRTSSKAQNWDTGSLAAAREPLTCF